MNALPPWVESGAYFSVGPAALTKEQSDRLSDFMRWKNQRVEDFFGHPLVFETVQDLAEMRRAIEREPLLDDYTRFRDPLWLKSITDAHPLDVQVRELAARRHDHATRSHWADTDIEIKTRWHAVHAQIEAEDSNLFIKGPHARPGVLLHVRSQEGREWMHMLGGSLDPYEPDDYGVPGDAVVLRFRDFTSLYASDEA